MEKTRIEERLYCLGNPPGEKEKLIYIHQSHKAEPEVLSDLFSFALEAYASGYHILVPYFSSTIKPVLEAAFLLDRALYVMKSDGLDDFRLNRSGNKIMLLRGGFLSPFMQDRDNKLKNIMLSRHLSLEKSTATLILDNDYGDIAGASLDMGHDIAVLRSTMKDPGIRKLVKEGCPVLDTFSSWLEMPKAISFKMENGPFINPMTDERYSMIIL